MLNTIKAFPRNLWVLTACQMLLMSSTSMIILIGGLLGTYLAPEPRLATLPITSVILGLACATVPAALLMKRIGRKRGSYVGLSIMLLGALLSSYASYSGSFFLLIFGTFAVGSAMTFAQQFRFAALESLSNAADSGPALSLLMFGGIAAAFLGPELGIAGKNLIDSPHGYAGSFLLLAVIIFLAMLIFSLFKNPTPQAEDMPIESRPLSLIVRSPIFIVAVTAGAIGYGLMSLIMTATPISMHEMTGHSLEHTKWVIQSHIVAMYLPSLISGVLIKHFGVGKILLIGSVIYAGTLIYALQGQQVIHYWGTLVMLGVGWNFLFLSSTVLLTEAYKASERFKTQAANELLIFGTQAAASLLAGWLLFQVGWEQMILICVPIIGVVFAVSAWLFWIKRNKHSEQK